MTEAEKSGLVISFGKTLPYLASKTVTRRTWKDAHAKKFVNAFDRNKLVQAFDKDRRYGGKQIGWCRLLCAPYKERLSDMPIADLEAEGGMCRSIGEFVGRYFKGDNSIVVWVVRFEFFADADDQQNEIRIQSSEQPEPGLPKAQQLSLFDGDRTTLSESIALSTEYLRDYFSRYSTVAIAYSGGKDSSATVSFVLRAIETGAVPRPKSLTVVYADTRLELPPLHQAAMKMLEEVRRRGFDTKIAVAPVAKRFLPYILGRGVPPPNNSTLRWCTNQIKVQPMNDALAEIRDILPLGERLLMLTGVRVGESAVRDRRIFTSCSKNGAECGQGWFQSATHDRTDTFAPIIHWRVCQVWEWLVVGAIESGFPTLEVAEAYGGDEAAELGARTGCIGCPLTEKDTALDRLIETPKWAYLAPLKKLKPIYREMRLFENRLQKDGSETRKDGSLASNPNRKGPLTLEARMRFLDRILAIQSEVNELAKLSCASEISLIDEEEEEFIRQCIADRVFPNKWSGDEPRGDEMLPQAYADGSVQLLLW